MFKWFQDQINKKRSSSGRQEIEIATEAVATEAVCDGTIRSQLESGCGEGSSPPDLTRTPLPAPKQDLVCRDSSKLLRKRQDEAAGTLDASPQGCLATDLLHNPHSSHSSFTSKGEGTLSDIHTDCLQQHLTGSIHAQQCTEGTENFKHYIQRPSIQQTNRSPPSPKIHKSILSSSQTYRENTGSKQDSLKSTDVKLLKHEENSSNSQPYNGGSSSSSECREKFFSPQEHQKGTLHPSATQRDNKNTSSLQHSGSSDLLETAESALTIEKLAECVTCPIDYFVSDSQEHKESTTTAHEHIANNSSLLEHRERTTRPAESNQHIVALTKSTVSSLRDTENTSRPQHTKCILNSQSTSSTQKPKEEDTFSTQVTKSMQMQLEHDKYQYSSCILDLTGNTGVTSTLEVGKTLSNPSLALATSMASARNQPDATNSSKNSIVSHETQNYWKDRKENQEPESKFLRKTESNYIPKENLGHMSNQPVDEVDLSCLQERNSFEKVKDFFSSEDESGSEALQTKMKASVQIGQPLPSVDPERKLISGIDTVLNKDEETEAVMVKVDRYTQTKTVDENFCNECPSLCCLHQACLYNQKGRKCTVLGEHYILTFLRGSPVLVRTTIEDSGTGPMGCMVAWVSGKAIEFGELEDGTEVYFDAVVSPKTSSFVTLIIWLNTKPAHSIEPYYSCYVIIEVVRNCPIKFVSFAKENGLVSAHIDGHTVNVMFSKSVVYIDGQKIENVKEIKSLSKPSPKQLYGDVQKLMTSDPAGKVVYGFTCSCIWLGCKPLHPDSPIVCDPLKLYKSTVGYFVMASKQSLLLCDRSASLEVRGASYRIIFESEGQLIELICDKKKIFSGNNRFQQPTDGKVKVHLRKQSAKGVCTWILLMVQVQPSPPSQPLKAAASSTQLEHNKNVAAQLSPLQTPSDISPVASAKSSPVSTVSPGGTEPYQMANNIDERDVMLWPQHATSREASSSGFDRNSKSSASEKVGKVAALYNDIASVTEEKSNEEHLKGLTQSPYPSVTSCSTVGKEAHVSELWVKENPESLVQGGQSYSQYVSCQDDQLASIKIIQNVCGVLKYVGETFLLEASILGELTHIEMGKAPWVAFDNGKGKRCTAQMPDMSVGFDAHFVDFPSVGLVGHILALWNGKKPLKASLEGTTYFYDVPGVYHGTNKEGCFKFLVMLEGNLTFITTRSTSVIFKANGEHCAAIATFSHVFLHLSMSQDLWTLLLVVLQPEHKHTHLIREESNFVCPKSSSLPDLKAEKNCRQRARCKTKTSDTHKTCQVPVMELIHYARNLHGTLAEKSGERVIITHYKNFPISVEIPENCNVDLNAVGQNIQDIPLGTKLHCDAFCENLESLRYLAVVVWLVKKPQKSVSHAGSTFYYNISGRCLSSNEEEASFEIFLEGKSRHLVCSNGCIIMPDGTYRALKDLKEGTAIQVNLLQENENEELSINQFIYITTRAVQDFQPSLLHKKQPEEGNKPADGVKKETTKMKLEVAKHPLNASQENLKSDEVQSVVAELPPNNFQENLKSNEMEAGAAEFHTNTIIGSLKSAEVKPKVAEPSHHGSQQNLKDGEVESGPSSLILLTTDKDKEKAISHNPVVSECEHIIVKGIISQPHQNTYTFTDDTGSLTANINPLKIAVDLPSGSSLPTREFYLLCHGKTRVGVCGWYQHLAQEVYLQLNMIVYAHNPENKVLTLGLPNKTSLYNFIFDSEVLVRGNKVQRQQELKSGLIVHPIIEDIKPHFIDGCIVSHRIAFLTTAKDVAATCVNFLKHSLLDNVEKKVPSIDQPLCHAVSVNHPLPKNSNILSSGDDNGRFYSQGEGGTLTASIDMVTDIVPKQQLSAKGTNDTENSFNESVDFPDISEGCSCSEISTHLQVVQFPGNIPSVDGEGDTLQELICSKYPRAVAKTHIIQYVTLYGEVQPGSSGTHVFSSRSLSSPIELPANLPHLDVSVCDSIVKCLMLARKICPKETGTIDHQPIVMWPEGKQCDPYIVVSYKVLWRKGLLMVTDATNGSEKWYLYDYNSVFSLKNTYKVNEVIKSFSKHSQALVLYALVESIPPLQIQGHYIHGNILLLTTSKRVAVAAVDIFIGSYYEDMTFQASDGLIGQLLLLHKIRMDRAMRCKRDITCYYPWKESSLVPGMMSVGGYLEAYTDDFAILRCNKRTTTAVCHISNVYYQGLKIISWKDIPKHLRKNFWAIILPLDETIREGKWEVDAVALVAWCCRGPQVLATHQCYYHVLTLYVPQVGPEESLQTTHTSDSHSEENFHLLPSKIFAGGMMSLTEHESWQCPAGSTIFAFHKSILQCSGLVKINGKVIVVNSMIILFMSTENEVVKCKMSNVFMKGKQCQSVREIMNEIDQPYKIFARKCCPITYSGKIVKMEGVIAFIGPLKSIGIHVCSKHSCVLNSSLLREEITIAEEVFRDIALLCDQSSQCSDYYLSKITIPEDEIPSSLANTSKTKKLKVPTLCHGVVVGLDIESDDQLRVKVTLQQGPDFLILPVCRSRLMGFDKDLPLQFAVGYPLKVMLDSMGTNYGGKSKILMAWGSFSQECNVSHNFIEEPEGLDTHISKSLCCPRALAVKEFQSLFNSDMFELKSLHKFSSVDEESGIGFFHYWIDTNPITCRTEYILGWPSCSSSKEDLWNLLVPKAAQIGKECPEAVAAWQSDTDSLVVGLCDIHGVNGVNVSCKGKDRVKIKSLLLSAANKERRNSEPQNIGLPVDHKLMQVSRSRHTSESQNSSPPVGPCVKPSSIVEENNPMLSRSLPSRMGLAFTNGCDVRNREYNQDLQHSFGSSTLLSISESSVTEEEGESIIVDTSQSIPAHPLFTSSVNGENDENLGSIENEKNIILRCTLTAIKSNSFIYTESHHGLLIDSTSHITALVSQGKLYIDKVKPKESLREIFNVCSQKIINAIVVPLATPITMYDLKVTHEAIVAWLGSRPAGIGSMIKNIRMATQQLGTSLQGTTNMKANLVEHEGNFSDAAMLSKTTTKVIKPHKGSMWAARPTLRIIYAQQETVSGCSVEGYEDHCGILKSTKGPILFERQLVNVGLQLKAMPGAPEAGQKEVKLDALVLGLEQPITVLDCEVKRIAVVVWSTDKPVMEDSLIARNLEVYKMNWIVIIIHNLSAVNKRHNLKKSTCRSFYEMPLFSDHGTSHCPEFVYYCSQDYTVRQHEVILVLFEHVLLKHQDHIVLALKDDVKCSMNSIVVGKYLQVIAVRVVEPFNYCSHLITHFALLVYAKGTKPPEAAVIMSDWNRGKIEKIASVKAKLDYELLKANIVIRIDKPAGVKPVSLGSLWPLTQDRPVGDMLFAAEGEVYKLMSDCGIMRLTGVTLNDNEIKMFFHKDAVLINDKHLSRDDSLDLLMLPVLRQAWQCTGQRLSYQETQSVMERTGEEVLYKAFLVWCEIFPSVQSVRDNEGNDNGKKLALNTVSKPEASLQSSVAKITTLPVSEQLVGGQVEAAGRGMGSLCAVNTPTTADSQPKMKHNSKPTEDPENCSNQQLKSTKLGCVTEVHRTVAQLTLQNGQLQYVARDRCFVYGVCLEKVELWHVLSIGLPIQYELTEDGKELKRVWVGGTESLNPSLLHTLQQWCYVNNVTPSATNVLLMEAGWLPLDLTPTVAPEEDIEVVEAMASHGDL